MYQIRQQDLKRIMTEKQMTIPEVSRASGLSEAGARKAARAEEGQHFRPKTVYALARALGVKASAFAVPIEG